MKFIATLLGIVLIIFGTLLIPFPETNQFQTQTVVVSIKKQEGGAEVKEMVVAEKAKPAQNDTQKEAENGKATGEVIDLRFDPIIGVISILLGIIFVFMGRKTVA